MKAVLGGFVLLLISVRGRMLRVKPAGVLAGARGSSMKAAATAVQQSLNGVLAGSMPLPRSSKVSLAHRRGFTALCCVQAHGPAVPGDVAT